MITFMFTILKIYSLLSNDKEGSARGFDSEITCSIFRFSGKNPQMTKGLGGGRPSRNQDFFRTILLVFQPDMAKRSPATLRVIVAGNHPKMGRLPSRARPGAQAGLAD
jgi:hypothetical protein